MARLLPVSYYLVQYFVMDAIYTNICSFGEDTGVEKVTMIESAIQIMLKEHGYHSGLGIFNLKFACN
jgi:hypothetical protein